MLKSKKRKKKKKTLGEGCEIKVLNVNIQHLFYHLHLITFVVIGLTLPCDYTELFTSIMLSRLGT